ncbi:MAG: tetratricopeptide repeat protein [Hyphomicrobiales bacterium]|nr:tetratricopeptide repeat protein [Hyphomicrobiales bacterium]
MFPRIWIACFAAVLGATAALADPVADCNQSGKWELRIKACSQLIAQAGKRNRQDREELALTYRRRGSAYLATGKPVEAMADFSQAIRFKPRYALAYYERGQAAMALANRDQAMADYDAAIRHKPRYWAAHVARGYLHLVRNEFDGAIADFNRAIAIEPNNAIAFNNRGFAWRRKGDLAKAIADYDRAVKLDPRYAIALANRGHAYEAQGKVNEARADFNLALSFDPTLSYAAAGLRRVGVNPVVTAESDHIVKAGRVLVEINCSPCHAIGANDASPNEKAPAFHAIQKRYPILTLRDPVSRGIAYPHRDMPKFNFSGEQIDTIIAYINSLPPGK